MRHRLLPVLNRVPFLELDLPPLSWDVLGQIRWYFLPHHSCLVREAYEGVVFILDADVAFLADKAWSLVMAVLDHQVGVRALAHLASEPIIFHQILVELHRWLHVNCFKVLLPRLALIASCTQSLEVFYGDFIILGGVYLAVCYNSINSVELLFGIYLRNRRIVLAHYWIVLADRRISFCGVIFL